MVLSVMMHGDLRRTTVDPFGDLPNEGYLKVEFAREGSSWRVRIAGRNREGYPIERQDATFPEEKCEQIVPKVATMAARMIEVPLLALEVPPAPPAPKVETVVIPPGPQEWDLRVGAGTEVGWGMLPRVKPGLRIEVGGRKGMASVAAELRIMLPVEWDAGQGRQILSHTVGLIGAGCLQWRFLGGCALLAGGWFYAKGVVLWEKRTDIAEYLGMGVRAFVEVPLPSALALRLEGDFVPTLAGVRVVVNRDLVLWSTPWYTLGGALKLVRTF